MQKEATKLLFHPNVVVSVCTMVLGISMYVMNSDQGLSDRLLILEIRQEEIFTNIEEIEENHLTHIQEDIDQINKILQEIQVELAK